MLKRAFGAVVFAAVAVASVWEWWTYRPKRVIIVTIPIRRDDAR